MATTPTTESGAYQTLDELRERIDYKAEDFFTDNEQLRFDNLLVRLESESRAIFETLWGDETPLTETDREDVKRATDDAAILMPYPVNDVSKVEIKRSQDSDWDELDSRRYDHTEHRLVLAQRPANISRHQHHHRSPLLERATRATWADICVKLRVTYDRGFGDSPPSDITSIQVTLVNRMLRQLKQEQTVAAASPEDFMGVSPEFDDIVTEAIRKRISDVTSPGGATLSV